MRKNQFFPSLAAVAVSLSLSRPLDLDQNKKKTQSTPFKIAVLLKTYPWTGLESFHPRRCPLKSGLTSFLLHELNSKSKTPKKKIISQQKNRTKQREMSL